MSSTQDLAEHEAESVEAVAAFHEDHRRQATPLQSGIDTVTDALGRPAVVISLLLGVIAWAAVTGALTGGAVDQPAFAWLELAGTLAALFVALLILVTQRREHELAERRAQFTLELALLADKKLAKTIALLEELRRDAPGLADRIDRESEDMAAPVDPEQVVAAIDEKESR
jgi:uncharacterized membrane protein